MLVLGCWRLLEGSRSSAASTGCLLTEWREHAREERACAWRERKEIEGLVVLVSGKRTEERTEMACAIRRWWRQLLGERW